MTSGTNADPLIGQTVEGRYLVRRLIGNGGMRARYEARHISLGKTVAITFSREAHHDAEALGRFRTEARLASLVVHQHVAYVEDFGTHEGIGYLVMELVQGRDLREAIAAEGPFEPARAIAIAVQLLRGLHSIHQVGIVHRDIKPANVLLTERGGDRDFVKLTGFGNSTLLASAAAPDRQPEQRPDLEAAGRTLIAMLVGAPQLAASSPAEVALAGLRPGLPAGLGAIIARAVAEAAADGFADASELAAALESLDG